MPVIEQACAQVGAQKPGAARDKNTFTQFDFLLKACKHCCIDRVRMMNNGSGMHDPAQ